MDTVTSVAKTIAGYTVLPIGRELGYIIFYSRNIDNLDTLVENLEAAKDTLQHSVVAAERSGEEIFIHVKNWLEKVDGTLAKAKEIQNDEEHGSVGCSSGSIPNLWTRHQLSRKATKMAEEISQVITEGNFKEISYLPRLPVAFTPSARGYEAVHSRVSILNEIMQEFKDANMCVIGVYGMGGVGKSTLIKELAWQAEHDGSFGPVIVATVTNSPNVKRIQGQLADGLGLKFNEETKEGRARRLWDRIRKENNILVIMDDIWKKLDLTEVGVPFGNDHRGCKLLLTSRNRQVLNNEMGTQKNFRLETLSEEESWNLFEKTAGAVVKDMSLHPTAFEVARRCMGLPLLIVTVAKALKNQDLYAWKDALIQLTKYDQEGLHSIANEAIELSYKYLESDQLKSLFLLIGSQGPKNMHIEDVRLYCWGLGVHKNVDGLADARNRLYKLIGDLKASCLLLEGEREWVRMHDVIREVAAKIASRVQPVFQMQRHDELKEWPKMDLLKDCTHISLPWCYIPELPKSLECPELELLDICSKDNYLKVPDNFFSGMRDLKVLSLGGMMCTPSLPPSLRFLKTLRVLYLYQCILEDIDIVSELTGLEILSLQNSEIHELPKKIQQLTHLRLLNLGNCSGLRLIPANLISSLKCLEELYMGSCYIQWEVEGSNQSNNASLGELRHLHHLKALSVQIQDTSIMPRHLLIFGKLERYNILIGDGWKSSGNNSGYFETSRTLKLKLSSTTITHLDHGVKILLNGVEDLYLDELKGVRNVLPKLNGEGFPQLKHFHIHNNAEMVFIIDSTEWFHPHHAFPNLESMIIRNLINLEKICSGPLPIHIFTKLQVIKVKGCDRLKNLLSFSMGRNLTQLLEIEISECKFMTNIIVEQEQEDFKDSAQINFPKVYSIKLECLPKLISFCSKKSATDIKSGNSATEYRDNFSNIPLTLFDEKVAMPNLQTMKVSSINTTKLWDDFSAPSCIQNLTSLTIDSCGSLTYLFSSSVGRALVKLQRLEITNCQMMENIFVLEGKLGNLPLALKQLSCEVTFPSLETLVISHMDNLKSVWHGELGPNLFPKLIKLEISFCQKLLNVFPSYVLSNLHNLETLLVTDCAALEVMFESQGLNNGDASQGKLAIQLRTMTLERLPMLKYIWSNDPRGSLQLHNLFTVKSTECQSLRHVFPLSVAMELLQLQVLDVRDCGVESIVAMGEMEEEVPRLVFPQLTSLTFWRLAQLRSFYPGRHTLDCPIIRKLDVYHCGKLEVFKPKSQNLQEDVPFVGQPLFPFEKVIPNIEELSLSSNDVPSICNGEHCNGDFCLVKALSLQCFHDESDKFPMGFLQRFTNLGNLKVACSSFVEIFSSENVGTIMKLKTLTLNGLDSLEYLCKDKIEIQPVLQNLETLQVSWCSRLRSIIPSSSSVLFQNLDKLWVGYCAGLVKIITSSSAKSLIKLRNLWIYNCEMIEEIVANEDDSDGGEITFLKLELLQLENLPRLTSFSTGNYHFKFPLLTELYVMECPMMETFSQGILSAPLLRQVCLTNKGDEWRWDGDLNTTIKEIFDRKDSKKDLSL